MTRALRRIVRTGVLAGIVGTAAMDLVWYGRYRRGGGAAPFAEWEFRSEIEGFDHAPAPAKVGQIVASKVHIDLPDRSAGLTNNVVHWSTGVTWGIAASLLRLLPGFGAIKSGVVAGVAAWSTSYAVLPKLGVYQPITEYDAKTLWKDLSAHLVFGSTMGATTFVLGGIRR